MSEPTRKSPSPSRRLMLFIHLVCVSSWIGATVAMTFLGVLGVATGSQELRRAAYQVMSVMDKNLIVPLVAVSIVSGIVLALRTPWGLFRHLWVMAKLFLTLGMVAFAVTTVMPWVRILADATAPGGDVSLVETVGRHLMAAAGTFLVALWMIVFLAVYKPWGAIRRSHA